MSDLCIFSCNADPLLIESAAHFGIAIKSYSPKWKGYVDGKLREGVKFLQEQTEPYAMFLDGADSLVLKPEEVILERIQNMGSPVLISAEKNCWPEWERWVDYPDAPKGFPPYLNSGGFIGLRGDVMGAMHTAIREAITEDDQLAWTIAFTCGLLPLVQIDYTRIIFHSMGDGHAPVDPCILHFNGRVKGRREMWEKVIGF